jgi:hypothetical protein
MVVCAQALRTSLFPAVHWFHIGIPVSHIERSLCNPPPIIHRREAGGGGIYFPRTVRYFLDQKCPTHVLKSELMSDVCHMTARFMQNGGRESLVPLLCNCVLGNTDRSRRRFISTSCVLIQAECPVLSHALLVPAYCRVLSHMQY